jgi:D-3-phosphoglycerate dehydrogenase
MVATINNSSDKKTKVKVLVTDPIDKEGLEPLFKNANFTVDYKPSIKGEELDAIIPDYDVLLVRSETKVKKDLLEKAKKLKFIGRAGTGVDNIDLLEATRHGCIVTNVPGGNTIAACEHTFALMLSLVRNVPWAYNSLTSGLWERKKFVGLELFNKVLLIIGFGRIGKEVCIRALSFSMKVLVYDPFVSQEYIEQMGAIKVELEEGLREADIISLHVPLTEQTKNLINRERISKMKDGVIIINCARGGIIDEEALMEALMSKKVYAAALDVYSTEPLPADSPLIKCAKETKLILTPHLGASTEEAQEKVAYEIANVVIDYFERGIVRNTVNFPPLEPKEKLEPFVKLCNILGKFAVQAIDDGISEVVAKYYGEIAKYNLGGLTAALLEGLLTPIIEDVNIVNAMLIAKERGIKITEIKNDVPVEFINVVSIAVKSEKETLEISGTIFYKDMPKITKISSLDVEISPEKYILLIYNVDKPGIIGAIGSVLGKNNINIGGMDVARDTCGGNAITVISVDSEVPANVLQEIKEIPGVSKIKFITL